MAEAVDAFVAVGSNIEPHKNVPEALRFLRQFVRVTGVSTFYRTVPLGGEGQADYRNGVWRVEASQPARSLKYDVLRTIESRLGRSRGHDRYAPRTIDLDLILYGDAVIEQPDLRIPDPDIRSRRFLVVALLELAPELVLPDTGERLAAVAEPGAEKRLEADLELTKRLRRSLQQ